VRSLLERVWKPARARALADRDALQALIAEEGGNFTLAPWDWRYYAEILRQRRANFDDAAIKPYLVLDHMIEAAFDCATRLFGITFSERKDVPVWHPDVRVWEVRDADGKHKALFYGDYFARPSKRSGAWMTSLRDQQKLDGEIAPLIINVCNFARGASGEPSLLSPDDARTLFHEFGHGLHGMLSNVTYPSLSGTSVFTDFVELPSQLYEHWQEQPQVLRQFAKHYQTGEPLPDELLARFLAARKFNQGFATGRVRLLGADRPRIPHPAGRGQPRRRGVREGGAGERSACPRKSRCGTGPRSSAISSPAITMRRLLTATCGRK
jgi:peptidyl-dipeptidase Dcp